jgi:short-subunit dehydrogenase
MHRYKRLNEQTMVITGASSGIGLAAARQAARAGAKVVLASRNEQVLQHICSEIRQEGGQAAYAVADVGDPRQVAGIVEVAIARFGGFDTWVNNAGVVIFSKLRDLPLEEHRRLFQTNYWGAVHGSQAAVDHFRTRPHGGTIINIASINAELPVPILSAYSASKAAVKAYSDALRMELMHDRLPVRVSVLKPSGISTPISDHGLSHMPDRGQVMPPLYDVQLVVDAILAAAQRPIREVTIGETGALSTLAWKLAPSMSDQVMSRLLPRAQSSGKPKLPDNNLFDAGNDGEVYLDGRRHGISTSPYTQARLQADLATAAKLAGGIGLLAASAAVSVFGQALRRLSGSGRR